MEFLKSIVIVILLFIAIPAWFYIMMKAGTCGYYAGKKKYFNKPCTKEEEEE